MGGNVVDKKLDLATEQLLLRLPAVRALRRARMVGKEKMRLTKITRHMLQDLYRGN